MQNMLNTRQRYRKYFGNIAEVAKMPNLIEVQKKSYDKFLQRHITEKQRKNEGLQQAFDSVFPINDFAGRAILQFVKYEFDKPKYDVDECHERGMTYAAPLRVTIRLIVFDIDETTEAKSVKDIKEQDVYMGDLPLMTDNGTFVINGTERVIVSQMHRSPGVFYDHDRGKTHASGKILFAARIIPYRGSWLDFEFDAKDFIYARIDRRRKIPVSTLLFAIGLNAEQMLQYFYDTITFSYNNKKKGWEIPFIPERYRGTKRTTPLVNAKNGEVIAEVGQKMTPRLLRKLTQDGITHILIPDEELIGMFIGEEIVNEKNGLVYIEAGDEINEQNLNLLRENGYKKLQILDIDHVNIGAFMRNTIKNDKADSTDKALVEIYRLMRPGEPPTKELAQDLLKGLFFDPEKYDLSDVGRVKMNMRLDLDAPPTLRVLRKEDIMAVIKTLADLRDGRGEIDDIDHLGNRRVRSVGELMGNQYRVGLLRMERAIKERMGSIDIDAIMPNDLINAKPIVAVVREFFGSSQLSQFMDQTNPLSELTHKRRLSALGPGGLTRERAGFEVRDVHLTHYGRICPIESPEGPNIGLISSLATYARINKYGFIETLYRKVENGKITDETHYLSAIEENKYFIGQSNIETDKNGHIKEDLVTCRKGGDLQLVPPSQIAFTDVSPKQLVSVSASLIPFLENDDASRALMGSNMQRQAVPLVNCEAPLVGTGMEDVVARDSGAAITARRTGTVDQVDAKRIVIRATEEKDPTKSGIDIYNLRKFQRSNQDTCINQKPLVEVGEKIREGEIIADGPATDLGDLALGRNVLVAFMPWHGYNFEDSVLISERMVHDDVFTSIHIEEFSVMARDTKLGPEEITRDIPNIGEEGLKYLDEAGIVYIGAEVKAGDILVGKITPKGESPMTPEEKLLRAIFGEKASDVRDTSLYVPPGVSGTVVEVRVFNRHGVDKDERAQAIEREEIEQLARDRDDEIVILDRNSYERFAQFLIGKKTAKENKDIKAEHKITQADLDDIPRSRWWNITLDNEKANRELEAMHKQYLESVKKLEEKFRDKVDKLQRGDELPPGVMRVVKVFVAVKRKIQVGDKIAGRHGNKGVISRVAAIEDMPYLEDGTAVDFVLSPLAVPSRMNVGQILETHLGWACSGIGKKIGNILNQISQDGKTENLRNEIKNIYGKNNPLEQADDKQLKIHAERMRNGVPIATPVFDSAKENEIVEMLDKAGLDVSGQVTLYDGATGDQINRSVTVGYMYIMKLHHLVDDKIHARSIGPYSLVTQQPLGGKAQFGGQRFGEMEVWALEAYGAAYTLQEILTVKSDDVAGRSKVYEAIVRGDDTFEAGIPESFNVLVKEIRSLGLNVELKQTQYP